MVSLKLDGVVPLRESRARNVDWSHFLYLLGVAIEEIMTEFVRDREPLKAWAGDVGRVKDCYPCIAEDDAAAHPRLVGAFWNNVDVFVFGDAMRIHRKCIEAMFLSLALSALAGPR